MLKSSAHQSLVPSLQKPLVPYSPCSEKNPYTSRLLEKRTKRVDGVRRFVTGKSRELDRDRARIERVEEELMGQIRTLVARGEVRSARLISLEILRLRHLHAHNFLSSTRLRSRAEKLTSEHAVHRGTVEAFAAFSNLSYWDSRRKIPTKVGTVCDNVEIFEETERIVRERMDDIYDDEEWESKGLGEVQVEDDGEKGWELEAVINQAFARERTRWAPYKVDRRLGSAPITLLHVRPLVPTTTTSTLHHIHEPKKITVPVDTTDISVSMLKRAISRDPFFVRVLGLMVDGEHWVEPFDICNSEGKIYDGVKSLKELKLDHDDTVWIKKRE